MMLRLEIVTVRMTQPQWPGGNTPLKHDMYLAHICTSSQPWPAVVSYLRIHSIVHEPFINYPWHSAKLIIQGPSHLPALISFLK